MYLSVHQMYDLSADLGNVVIPSRMECDCLCHGKKGERVAKVDNLLMNKLLFIVHVVVSINNTGIVITLMYLP